jgi:hypothetical protein
MGTGRYSSSERTFFNDVVMEPADILLLGALFSTMLLSHTLSHDFCTDQKPHQIQEQNLTLSHKLLWEQKTFSF